MNKPCAEPEQHDPHPHGADAMLEWCDGAPAPETARFFCTTHACGECAGCKETALLAELAEGEVANMHARPCQVCEALTAMSEVAASRVRQALAGTIGERRLAEILTRGGYTTGTRAVNRHRREAHTP